MKVLVLLSVLGLVSCGPAPQFDIESLKDIFKNIGGGGGGYESEDDSLEKVPYKTLNKTIDGDLAFEVREYPAVEWVCTEKSYDMPEVEAKEDEETSDSQFGFLSNLAEKFSGNWKKRPSSGMFMKLFRYISGVNKERQEIEMTSPVLSKMSPNQDTNMMTNRMCFYLDSAAQENPPTPDEEDVYLMTSDPLTVAVYEFGGYAMKDSVWLERAAEFKANLGDRANSLDTNNFYTAGYDSPMKIFNRKNEVMFELKN